MEIKLTEKEQARKQRNDAMLEMYTKLLSEYPDVKPWRILRTIAVEFDLTPEGVSFILKGMGAYINNNTDGNDDEE
ncbi:MAG: hypothetical protein IIZ44_00480 [Muribaculaceae bacterium]|jgi:hypothetical protein|nr:hypothetical protein [Muribaculaceae bacterium]